MADIVGSGDFKYRIIENWAKLPDGWSFKEVAAVGAVPACMSPKRDNSLPWWSTMLTRGPRFGLLRLTGCTGPSSPI